MIIPTKDDFSRLRITLLSLKQLSLESCQIIVVNGGAALPTSILKILDKLPVNLIQEPDKGIYDAMNHGAETAKGYWLYFLNCGDTISPSLSPKAFLDILSIAAKDSTNAIFFRYSLDRYPKDILRSMPRLKQLLPYFSICHQSVIISRLTHIKLHGYDLKYKYHADRAFFSLLFSGILSPIKICTTTLHLVIWQSQGFCTSNQVEYNLELAALVQLSGLTNRLLSRTALLFNQILLRFSVQPVTINRIFYQ